MLERIKVQAKNKGWSMSHLCRQLNIHVCFFTDVKNGKLKITDDRLNKIAQLLNCSVEYLKGETDDPSVGEQLIENELSPIRKELYQKIQSLSEEQVERLILLLDSFEKRNQ